MKLSPLGLALVCSAALLPGNALGQPAAGTAQQKVGQIYIVGNQVTRQDVILKQLPRGLSPGQPLRYTDLALAERNLTKLGIFEVNEGTGVRPTVEVLDRGDDEEYKDLLIRAQETSTCSVRRMIGLNCKGELVASIVFEERNFDPLRFPTSWDDLKSGRAFRGGCLTLRLELIQVPLLPIGVPGFLRSGSILLPSGGLHGFRVRRGGRQERG